MGWCGWGRCEPRIEGIVQFIKRKVCVVVWRIESIVQLKTPQKVGRGQGQVGVKQELKVLYKFIYRTPSNH